MDPIAHTLVGATLAETGLRRRTPLATAALVLGANAPDIDIVASFIGSDAALEHRRGITHGAIAMIALPIALTGLLLAFDRGARSRLRPEAPQARPLPLLLCATLAVLTHPFLDWLNTYGVRLLMPFDDTWFYGDTLFILDPWLWLLTAAGVVLARSEGKLSLASWIVLGSAASALVVGVDLVPLGAKVVWALGIALIVALRLKGHGGVRARVTARVCAGTMGLYVAIMLLGSQIARSDVDAWLRARGIEARELASGPIPADPFAREVIARTDDSYYFITRRFVGEPAFRFSHAPIPLGPRNAITDAALDAPRHRGLRSWLRFPAFEVESDREGYVVHVHDVRYGRRVATGLGTATVYLDRDLRVR